MPYRWRGRDGRVVTRLHHWPTEMGALHTLNLAGTHGPGGTATRRLPGVSSRTRSLYLFTVLVPYSRNSHFVCAVGKRCPTRHWPHSDLTGHPEKPGFS